MENLIEESYGKYLKKVRIEKGFSIETICYETKISRFIIEQIELENRENLPEEVFLKGFLKSYAEVLGLDPVDVLKRYRTPAVEGPGDEDEHEAWKTDKTKLFIAGGIISVVLLVFLVIYFFTPMNGNKVGEMEEKSVVTAPAETVETRENNDEATPGKNMVLDVVCVEGTTIKVSTDGNIPVEYALKPEDRIKIKAMENYNILIDNNCGVRLFMGDKPVEVPGKCGQVVNVRLP